MIKPNDWPKEKAKEQFGKGSVQGVLAPEAANNAVSGGAIIPLLSLGIPGDAATAVILGGLLIHGVTPGPALFIENKSAGLFDLHRVLCCNRRGDASASLWC
jgi:TctA family transporter